MTENDRIIYDDRPWAWYPDNGFTQWEAVSRSQERSERELGEGESLGRYTGQCVASGPRELEHREEFDMRSRGPLR